MAARRDSNQPIDARFGNTRWSLVLAAAAPSSPDQASALASLCDAYWLPIYAIVRRKGYQRAEAEDLTQSFFVMLLEREDLRNVNPEKGRFRSFLLAALQHFLINEWGKGTGAKAWRRQAGFVSGL